MNVVVDLGVYGENGFTTHNKRDLQGVPPELNHSTIAALARTPSDYEIVIHPGDFAYADDWVLTPSDLLHGKEAYEAIIEVSISSTSTTPQLTLQLELLRSTGSCGWSQDIHDISWQPRSELRRSRFHERSLPRRSAQLYRLQGALRSDHGHRISIKVFELEGSSLG